MERRGTRGLGEPPQGLALHRRAAALRAFAEPEVAQTHAAHSDTQHSTAWLGAASRQEFAGAVGHCYESAPWVAERGHDAKPAGKSFTSLADIEAALWNAVTSASDEEQLMLLNAYPDPAEAYPEDRFGSLTAAETQRFRAMTTEYKTRFGFPFILAARNATKRSALRAIETPLEGARGRTRLHNDPGSERAAALAQVRKMASMRLRMTVLLERVFATWRDYARLREVYNTSKVLGDDVRVQMLRMERGMLFARYRQSERYPDICEMSVSTALRSTARVFLAWRQLLQLLSLYKEAARREVGAESNPRKMLLDLGSDTPRMLRKYSVEELLFRVRVKYSPSEELVKQKHPHQRWKPPSAKPAGAPEKRWVSDTKIGSPPEPQHALPRKSGVIPENTGDRLHGTSKKNAEELQRKRETRRLEEQQREDAELTGRPAICTLPWASSSDRKREDETIADSLLRRKQEKEDRMLQKQERAARRRQKLADAGTHMSTGTRNITDRLDRGMPIEDMLLAQGELSKQRRNYLRHLKEQEDRVSIEMGPSITHAADALDRQGNVCERLFDEARQNAAAQAQEEAEPLFDRETGRRFFSPAINASSWNIVRDEPVEDALFREAEENFKRQQQRERRKDAEHQMASLQPKMTQHSQLLVGLMEMRNGGSESTQNRLKKPTRCIKPSTLEDLEKAEEEYSFAPRVNADAAVPSQHSKSVFERLHEDAEKHAQAAVLETTRRMEEEAEQQHRFKHPDGNPADPASASNLANRLTAWAAEREEHLAQKRLVREEELAEEEMRDATFAPEINC